MAEDGLRWIDKALPLDDVDSSDIDLAGRLAELVNRLAITLDDLTGEHPLAHWLDALGTGMARLADVTETDAWLQAQAQRELAQVADDAGDRVHTIKLTLADVRPARRPATRPSHPSQLPHRRADHVLDGADALGATSGRLPARVGRRPVPAHSKRRRRRRPRP